MRSATAECGAQSGHTPTDTTSARFPHLASDLQVSAALRRLGYQVEDEVAALSQGHRTPTPPLADYTPPPLSRNNCLCLVASLFLLLSSSLSLSQPAQSSPRQGAGGAWPPVRRWLRGTRSLSISLSLSLSLSRSLSLSGKLRCGTRPTLSQPGAGEGTHRLVHVVTHSIHIF